MKSYNDTIILATANQGKVREFSKLLAGLIAPEWQLVDRLAWSATLPDTVEDAETFEGNAVKKAVEIARATGCCALSDDSGLQVDALHGAPGVYSARYAGEDAKDADNNAKLVRELADVPMADRSARFVSVVCLAIANNDIGNNLLARVNTSFTDIAPGKLGKEGEWVRDNDIAVIWFRGAVEGMIVEIPQGDGGFGYDPHFYVPSSGK